MDVHLLHDSELIERLSSLGRPDDGHRAHPRLPTSSGVELAVLAGVAFLLTAIALDSTIISVALPTIRNDIGGGAAAIQWVASIYFLSAAVLLVPAGRMVDLVGPKRVILVGGLVYLGGSVLGMLAWQPWTLILGRAVQGAGSGIVSPAAIVLVAGVYGPRRRGSALGMISTVLAAASAAGPLVGGALTATVGWRFIFLAHTAMAVVGVGLTRRAPTDPGGSTQKSLDGRGVLGWAVVILTFQLGVLHWGDLGPWGGSALLLATVSAMAALVRHERRSAEPLVDLRLLRIPRVAAATIARIVVAFAFFGSIYYLTLFLQSDAGYGPFQTGLILLPASLAGVVASPFVGRLIDRTGSGLVLWLGTAATALSLFLLAVVKERSSVVFHIAPALIVSGLGYAMVSVASKSAPLEAVPESLKGRATSLVSVTAKAAAGLGVTLTTGMFNLYSGAGVTRGLGDNALPSTVATTRDFVLQHLGSSNLASTVTPGAATQAGFSSVAQAIAVITDSFAFSMSLALGSLAVLVAAGAALQAVLLHGRRDGRGLEDGARPDPS